MSVSHAYYMNELFNPEQQAIAIKRAKKELRKVEFDSILVSGGVSGMFGAILAHRLGKRLVVARKASVSTHSSYKVENVRQSRRLVFVDDLVGTGDTLRFCCQALADEARLACSTTPLVVGAWLYNENRLGCVSYLRDKQVVAELLEAA